MKGIGNSKREPILEIKQSDRKKTRVFENLKIVIFKVKGGSRSMLRINWFFDSNFEVGR